MGRWARCGYWRGASALESAAWDEGCAKERQRQFGRGSCVLGWRVFCVKILLFFAFFVKPFKRRKGFPDLTLFSHGALPRRRSRGRGAIRGDAVARAHHER
jgi:hypothetical protein